MSQELDHTKFAEYVVQKWQNKVQALGIIDTRALIDSFKYEVIANSSGDVSKMLFTFRWYGRMVDMGLGKGVTQADAGLIGSRQPKRWFTPIFLKEVGKLSKLMASDLEFRINKSLSEALQT